MNQRRSVTALVLLPFLLALLTATAHGAAQVATEHATVTLLAERPRVAPGQTLWLGLHFELVPHWHVYWRNPGASGTAPVIRWTLPDGWDAGDIHWPVPKRIRVGPLTNYGYEDSVTFLVPVRVPESPLPAGPLTDRRGGRLAGMPCRVHPRNRALPSGDQSPRCRSESPKRRPIPPACSPRPGRNGPSR